MEDILDGLRRIVSRWVETETPIRADVNPGDTVLTVDSTIRFKRGDEVIIEDGTDGEPNLVIDSILDNTHLQLATPVFNAWTVAQNIVLKKLTNGMYVQGIYIGQPNVIPDYPAITINGTTVGSEPFTLSGIKDRFEVELTIMVPAATQEDGYRFLLRLTKLISDALKNNFYPLVNDYDVVALTGDVLSGDEVVSVPDSSIFITPNTDSSIPYPWVSDARAILEDRWKSEETRVQEILSPTEVTIRPVACGDYKVADNAIIICPHRHLFNTWPHAIDFGTTSKEGTLLQTSVIRWFAEESIPYDFRNSDPHLK